MELRGTLVILITTCILITVTLVYLLNKKKHNQLVSLLSMTFGLLLLWIIGLILQITFCNTFNISPIYFDYFVYIATCFLPVVFLFLSITFSKTKFKFTKKYLLFFIIPITSLLVLWTNDFHHLFYKVYSTSQTETVFGPYFYIHSIYTYALFIISIFTLLRYSIKNSGFFSKQAILILLGSLFPLITNLFGFLNIFKMNIYMTPIAFVLTVLCYAFAILKFDFLKVTPIALQRIVDRISDGYIVIDENKIITDFNKTFLDMFKLTSSQVRNMSILLPYIAETEGNSNEFISSIDSSRHSNETIKIERYIKNINKYFNIEINSITNKNDFLGTLILFKDITQHISDMQTIKANQDILVERERLATLGQMIGGIAHNLKTPIMSIAGAAEGLSDLIEEYRTSITDSEVTVEDHYDIAKDMDDWIQKIRTHLSYMSDIITAVKGQAVTFSDNSVNRFTVEELLKTINILMKHELKNALIDLVVDVKISPNTVVQGNVNSLVQVVNNIISNAIQAYNGKASEKIFLSIYQRNNTLVIKVQDNAGGLPAKVQEKLFKEMITTKGKNGTGLGLFMSYSNIKAHFNGILRFETAENIGTSFFIEIPL